MGTKCPNHTRICLIKAVQFRYHIADFPQITPTPRPNNRPCHHMTSYIGTTQLAITNLYYLNNTEKYFSSLNVDMATFTVHGRKHCQDLFHMHRLVLFNSLRPRQNGRHFADDIFKCILVNENVRISIKTSLKIVPKGPINIIPAMFQIMAWRRPGDKPLSEAMLVSLPTHICVTRPQWVNVKNS